MTETQSKQSVGTRGEDLACAELQRQGLQVLERNWRCSVGEIDIVAVEMTDEDSGADAAVTLVFCEVKCRTGLGFGHPLEAITFKKLQTLRQLAAIWTRTHQIRASTIRLDAIGVVLLSGQEPRIDHVKAIG